MTTRKYDAKKTVREERKNAVLKNGVKRVPTKKTLPKRVPLSQENKVKTVLDESKKVHEKRERGRLAMASRLGVSTLYTNALERAANGSLSTAPNKASPSRAVVSPTVLPNLSVRAKLASDALFGVGIGPVMFAVQRGWAISKPTYPLAAINFIGNILLAACLNQTPPVSELPRWLAVVYQALIPKVVTHGNLRVAYSWETDATLENFSIGSTYSNGPSGMSFHLNFGVVQTTDMTNTTFFDYAGAYPIANTVYNPVEGPNAWADLLKFLSDLFPGNRMHEKVSPTKPNKFTNDASAFAISTANPGGSMANTGAPGSRKSLETPLATPMLSVFTPIVSSVSVTNRCPKWSVLSGGGPVELGLLLFTINSNSIRKLVQPKFKFVDFYRTADKIIRSAVLAVQRRLDSDEAKLIQLVNSNEIEAQIKRIVPQMTLQDCLYIIRNEMMTALGDTQVFCQTLFPDAQAQNGIVPFTCTIGTCPLGKTNQMLLPSLLAEEIKSYTSRLIDVPNHDPASKYPKELDFYIGILCQINGYGLSENDYYVSVLNPNRGTNPDKYPFFLKSPNAAEEKPKMPSSPSIFAKKPKLDADVNISLVDGSGGTTFYAINTPDFLNPRIEAWNKFVGDFSDIFEKTVKVGKDGGVVTSLGKTDYITVATSDMKVPRKKYGENNNNGVFYGYGSNLSVISTSYRDQPIEVIEQGLPFSAPIAFLSSGAQNDEVIANLSSLNGEYLSTVKSATPTTVLVSENTLDSVNLCVMTKDGVPNSTTTGLEQLSKEGGGGIFAEALGILGNVGGGIIDSFI